MNKKVWRDGYKYPQNSIPPFFHYILIVKCQFLSVNFFNTNYRIRVKFFFVRHGLGSQGKISRCVLLVCSYLQVEEKCGRLITSVYKIVRSFVGGFVDKFFNNLFKIIHRKHATYFYHVCTLVRLIVHLIARSFVDRFVEKFTNNFYKIIHRKHSMYFYHVRSFVDKFVEKFINNFFKIIQRKHATYFYHGCTLARLVARGLFNENGERMLPISRAITLLEI